MTVSVPAANEPVERAAPEDLWVGDWRVAADLNHISRDGIVVRLEPKAMAVLLHLACRPRQVASREELLAAVWPGLVVGDNALTQVVIKLRKALGDTAREPAYVESIAKKGYRLIAEVRQSGVGPPGDLPVSPEGRPARRRPTLRRGGVALAAVLLVGAAIWAWQSATRHAPTASAANADARPASQASLPTVLVESFKNLGPKAEQSPIAQAVTVDLVTDLSKVSGIRVASRRNTDDAARAGDRLQASYVLSGTLQEEGNRLRLNVLLTEAGSGRAIWTERFDRRVKDLFTLQDDLVRSILDVLPVKVSDAEIQRLAQRDTRNLQAYRQFIRARGALQARRPAQNEMARELYWDAIRLDPTFARAYAGVAMTYALEYQQGWARDGNATLGRAFEIAETSLDMSRDMPEVHWVLGFVRAQRRQHEAALRDLDDALRLNPSYADAYALKGGIYTYIGRPADSLPLLREALRLSPDAGSLYFLLLGRAYYFLGDADQARVNLNYAIERNTDNLEAHVYLAATQWLTGDRDSAQWQVNEIRSLEPDFSATAWLATYPMTDPGQVRRLLGALTAMGL